MALTATLQLQVPALPDNDYWFINAAAWSNYWQNIQMTAEFQPAANTKYIPSPFDPTTPVELLNIDGVEHYLPSLARFISLQTQLAALDNSFQDLRTSLKTAGYITNAQ